MINPMDLSGKFILVTGASSGIGRTTAIHLSKLGGRIALIARNETKLKETLAMMAGEGHIVYPFDLAEVSKIEELIKHIVKDNGRINGLVHCAGIATLRPLMLTNSSFLHDMMSINFFAFVELVRCASKKNNYIEGASFVGMSSVGSQSGDKSKTAYCASKAAMDAAARCMAKELQSKKIRVNTVVGGFVKTDMYEMYIDQAGEEAFDSNILGRQILGMGEPLDVANAMAYLLSDASKFVTGSGLIVDGGYLS